MRMMKSTITTEQYRELLNREARGEFGEDGLGPDLQWVADNWKKIRDLRKGHAEIAEAKCIVDSGLYRLVPGADPQLAAKLRPRQTLADFLAVTGQDWTNPFFAENNFLLVDDGTTGDVIRWGLGRFTGPEAMRAMQAEGLRPVGLKRNLEYLLDNPEEQMKGQIVVLGSRWKSPGTGTSVPCFTRKDKQRIVDLRWYDVTLGGGVVLATHDVGNIVDDKRSISTIFPLRDEELPEKFYDATARWRKYAVLRNYSGPVAWRMKKGFTIDKAPLIGPCQQANHPAPDNLSCADFKNSQATRESILFWVPRLAEHSVGETMEQMKISCAALRDCYGLPLNHCRSFGTISELFALILGHWRSTGEKVPLGERLYAVSDTCFKKSGEPALAGAFGSGLHLYYWGQPGGARDQEVGFFLFGEEVLTD